MSTRDPETGYRSRMPGERREKGKRVIQSALASPIRIIPRLGAPGAPAEIRDFRAPREESLF